MAIVTTYSCDKCDHKQLTSEQMWFVGVYYQHADGRYDFNSAWRSKEQMWCRKCTESAGLVPAPSMPKSDPPPPPPPTLEDMVREIAAQVADHIVRDRTGA